MSLIKLDNVSNTDLVVSQQVSKSRSCCYSENSSIKHGSFKRRLCYYCRKRGHEIKYCMLKKIDELTQQVNNLKTMIQEQSITRKVQCLKEKFASLMSKVGQVLSKTARQAASITAIVSRSIFGFMYTTSKLSVAAIYHCTKAIGNSMIVPAIHYSQPTQQSSVPAEHNDYDMPKQPTTTKVVKTANTSKSKSSGFDVMFKGELMSEQEALNRWGGLDTDCRGILSGLFGNIRGWHHGFVSMLDTVTSKAKKLSLNHSSLKQLKISMDKAVRNDPRAFDTLEEMGYTDILSKHQYQCLRNGQSYVNSGLTKTRSSSCIGVGSCLSKLVSMTGKTVGLTCKVAKTITRPFMNGKVLKFICLVLAIVAVLGVVNYNKDNIYNAYGVVKHKTVMSVDLWTSSMGHALVTAKAGFNYVVSIPMYYIGFIGAKMHNSWQVAKHYVLVTSESVARSIAFMVGAMSSLKGNIVEGMIKCQNRLSTIYVSAKSIIRIISMRITGVKTTLIGIYNQFRSGLQYLRILYGIIKTKCSIFMDILRMISRCKYNIVNVINKVKEILNSARSIFNFIKNIPKRN